MNPQLQPKNVKPRLSLKRRKISGNDQIGRRKSLLKIEKLSLPAVAPKLKQKVVNKLQDGSQDMFDADTGDNSKKSVDKVAGLDAKSTSNSLKVGECSDKGEKRLMSSPRSDSKAKSDIEKSERIAHESGCSSKRTTPAVVIDNKSCAGNASSKVERGVMKDKKRDEVDNGCVVDEGGGDSGLGDLFFCHLCQKDLTKFTPTRRQLHLNRCCDDDSAKDKAVKDSGLESPCVICHKKFTDFQVRTAHMKACAKKNHISTAALLDMVKGHQEEGISSPEKVTRKQMDLNLKDVIRTSDGDFKKPPPPKRKKRKKEEASDQLQCLQDIEAEQLQLALAMSASLHGETGVTAEEEELPRTRGRRKRTRKKESEVFPLLTVSTQQSRDILASRAEQLLEGGASSASHLEDGLDGGGIPCTPAFGGSSLAGEQLVRDAKKAKTKECGPDTDEHIFNEAGKQLGGAIESKGVRLCETDDHLFCSSGEEEEDEVEELNLRKEVHSDGTDEDDKTIKGQSREVEGMSEDQEEIPQESREEKMDSQFIDDPLPASPQPTDPIKTSFVEELKGVAYPTLWQLGSGELSVDSLGDFYVSALSSLLSPAKKNPLWCDKCSSEICLQAFNQSRQMIAEDDSMMPPHTGGTSEHSGDTSKHVTEDQCSNAAMRDLQSDLDSLVGSPLLSDMTILTAWGSELRAHGCILAARCPGFRQAVLTAGATPKVLDLSEFPREVVLVYLKQVYTAVSDESFKEEMQPIAKMMCSVERVSQCIRYDKVLSTDCSCTSPTAVVLSTDHSVMSASSLVVSTSHSYISATAASNGTNDVSLGLNNVSTSLPPLSLPPASPALVEDNCSPVLCSNSNSSPILPVYSSREGVCALSSLQLEPTISVAQRDELSAELCLNDVNSSSARYRDSTLPEQISSMAEREKHSPDLLNANSSSFSRNRGSTLPVQISSDHSPDLLSVGSSSFIPEHDDNTPVVLSSSNSPTHIVLKNSDSPEFCVAGSPRLMPHPDTGVRDDNLDVSEPICPSPSLAIPLTPPTGEREGTGPAFTAEEKNTHVVELSSDTNSSSVSVTGHNSPDLLGEGGGAATSIAGAANSAISPQLSTTIDDPVENFRGHMSDTDFSDGGCFDSILDRLAAVPVSATQPLPITVVSEMPQAFPTFQRSFASFQDGIASSFLETDTPSRPPPTVGMGTSVSDPPTPASADLVTPQPTGVRIKGGGAFLLSDDAITPTPDYHHMRTPMLKSQCAKFGVKALPKKKMIAKLEEIYEYTHPLVAEDGTIVHQDGPDVGKASVVEKLGAVKSAASKKSQDIGSLHQQVRDIVASNHSLYHDILLYKPLELGEIQAAMKSAGLTVGKDKLRDILDIMCVTFSEARSVKQKIAAS